MSFFDVPPPSPNPPSGVFIPITSWVLIVLLGEFIGWSVGVFVLRHLFRKKNIDIAFESICEIMFWVILSSYFVGTFFMVLFGGYLN